MLYYEPAQTCDVMINVFGALRVFIVIYLISVALLKCFPLFQKQTGKQLGALERSPFVSSGTHRMGDPQGYGTHGTGAHWRGRSLPAETTGDAYQSFFSY